MQGPIEVPIEGPIEGLREQPIEGLVQEIERVICCNNVASERGIKHAAILAQALAKTQRDGRLVYQLETTSTAELHTQLDAFDINQHDLLVVNGGDGTLQALLSYLITRSLQPQLAALPGGSTNMSAYDLNDQRKFTACVAGLTEQLAGATALQHIERPVLRVMDADQVQGGFFCGVGAVVQGIEYCHQQLYASGAKRREFTAGLAMLRAIWGVLRKQPPFAQSQRLTLAAFRSGTAHGDAPTISLEPESGVLVLAASTLQRLLMGARPHWGEEPGELRFTLVERDQQGLLYRLPGLLGFARWSRPLASAGYHSHNCQRLELSLTGGYTIDGELYTAQADKIELDVDCVFRFLRL